MSDEVVRAVLAGISAANVTRKSPCRLRAAAGKRSSRRGVTHHNRRVAHRALVRLALRDLRVLPMLCVGQKMTRRERVRAREEEWKKRS